MEHKCRVSSHMKNVINHVETSGSVCKMGRESYSVLHILDSTFNAVSRLGENPDLI